jgi:hypothetical protein
MESINSESAININDVIESPVEPVKWEDQVKGLPNDKFIETYNMALVWFNEFRSAGPGSHDEILLSDKEKEQLTKVLDVLNEDSAVRVEKILESNSDTRESEIKRLTEFFSEEQIAVLGENNAAENYFILANNIPNLDSVSIDTQYNKKRKVPFTKQLQKASALLLLSSVLAACTFKPERTGLVSTNDFLQQTQIALPAESNRTLEDGKVFKKEIIDKIIESTGLLQLYTKDENGEDITYQCSFTLIDKSEKRAALVTAKHCFDKNESDENLLNKPIDIAIQKDPKSTTKLFEVDKLIYNHDKSSDIAIVIIKLYGESLDITSLGYSQIKTDYQPNNGEVLLQVGDPGNFYDRGIKAISESTYLKTETQIISGASVPNVQSLDGITGGGSSGGGVFCLDEDGKFYLSGVHISGGKATVIAGNVVLPPSSGALAIPQNLIDETAIAMLSNGGGIPK